MNGTKRITIDNTLDERLRLLEDRVSSHFEQGISVTDMSIDVTGDPERFVRCQREQKVLFVILCGQLECTVFQVSPASLDTIYTDTISCAVRIRLRSLYNCTK